MIGAKLPGGNLLKGPFLAGCQWPLNLLAVLCDLQPRFLAKPPLKPQDGPEFRCVSRNGRVLLCGDGPLDLMIGRASRVRFQTWHRSALTRDRPEAYGLLLCVRPVDPESYDALAAAASLFTTRLVSTPDLSRGLNLDVGGGLTLEFRRG